MRLHRFYISSDLGDKNISISDKEVIHQLVSVFRSKVGQQVIFFNNSGFDYIYEIVDQSKQNLDFTLIEKKDNPLKKSKLTLAFSLIKNQNDELIIQKCTELGVDCFQPIISDRTEKKNINLDRSKKIATEAVEQSGRDVVPEICEPIKLSEFLNSTDDVVITFHMDGKNFSELNSEILETLKSDDKKITLLIGPEGGWSDEEIELFKNKKIQLYKINNAVLRAETAAILASGIIGAWNL
jgi:16S rRNA (uracil1498-N3)-methyltransferase